MADRVRMKSKSMFDNPLIFNHAKEREGKTTVQEGDEFSTEEAHATELELGKMADRIAGDVSERTDKQVMILGAQTPSTGSAIAGNRKTTSTPFGGAVPAVPAAPAKA